jgi:hypothetical protein
MPKTTSTSGQRGAKSAAVREVLAQDPKTPVSQIISRLHDNGIEVNNNLVYQIRRKFRAERRKEKRQATLASRQSRGASPATLVRGIKELAAQVGGMARLQELVEVLAQ